MSRSHYNLYTGVTQIGVTLKSKLAAIGVGVSALAVGIVMPFAAHAATSQVVVTPSNTQGWSTADTRANGQVTYVADATAPLGTAALSLKTTAATGSPLQDKAQYLKNTNTKLADLNDVSYWTKQNSASFEAGLPSFQLPTCLYGMNEAGTNCANVPDTTTSSFTTLVYEPYVDQGNAAVHNGEWQKWDVDAGKLWSSKTVAGLVSTQGSTTYTLSDLKASYPNAVVFQFGVNVGSNNPNYDTEVDGVTFNDVTYNFELTVSDSVSVPMIQTPANGAQLTSAQLTSIDWTDSTATYGPVTYQYRAYSDAGYTNLVYDSGNTLTSSQIPTPGTPNGTYYVQVQAFDAYGVGSGWSNDATNPYKITVRDLVSPANADQCKNNGWTTFNNPTFKNQGACVSFVASNGKSQH
jgi:hypothetical protein